MDDCAIAFSQKRLLWWQQRSDLDPLHLSGTLVYRWQPQMRLDLSDLASLHHKSNDLHAPAAAASLQGIGFIHSGD
jgi:hypothetical protein